MRIGILRHKKGSHAVRRLLEEAGDDAVLIDPLKLTLFINDHLDVAQGLAHLPNIDVLIPRLDSEVFRYELMVIDHFSKLGVPVLNSSKTIFLCQNKFESCLALKKAKIPQPNCAISHSANEMLKHIKRMAKPLIFKSLYGSYGRGVILLKSDQEAMDVLPAMKTAHLPIYIQEYLPHKNEDFRIFVVGGKIVGGMKRVAKRGQWKTNITLGNKATPCKLTREMRDLALRSTKAINADICGVDMIKTSHSGFQVIEVNQSPDFKGLEKATGKNVAREIIRYAKKKARSI